LKEQKHQYRRKYEKYRNELRALKAKLDAEDPIMRINLKLLAVNIQSVGESLYILFEKSPEKKNLLIDLKERSARIESIVSNINFNLKNYAAIVESLSAEETLNRKIAYFLTRELNKVKY
jgi:hypothetical protein